MILDLRDNGCLAEDYETGTPSLTSASTADGNDDEYLLRPLLSMTNHTYTLTDLTDEMSTDNPAAYMDRAYEDEYLATLDSQLVDDSALENVDRLLNVPPSRALPSDKDLTNQNSDSVLSWLRRHHPETFIQEKENAAEKPPPRARGGGKRASLAQVSTPVQKPAAAAAAGDHESADEDHAGGDAPEKGSARGKKSKDDEAYRPKGGSSKGKRKRAEEGEPSRRKKAKSG